MTRGPDFFFAIKKIESTQCAALSPTSRRKWYSSWIWLLTFLTYTSYHLSRKPISVVKNVLHRNCSDLTPPEPTNDTHWCEWAPFDRDNANALLGVLDSVYLFTYAFSMFFSGIVAERSRINVFLCIGMVCSGVMTALFGLGHTFEIHYFWYYLLVQMICGVVQSTGWPGVVATMGNWFGKKRRGLIMGIWNSHTSVGNIMGSLIASAFLNSAWELSFIVPGIIIGVMGIIVLFFLVPQPSDVGFPNPNDEVHQSDDEEDVTQPLLSETEDQHSDVEVVIPPETTQEKETEKPISFLNAIKIPGVVEFAMSLFFAKLVSYTFLYWLPHYIYDNTSSDADASGQISTFFDMGGIIGAISAGLISDSTGMPASTCSIMLIGAIPIIYLYQSLSTQMALLGNMLMLIPVGLFVNGPYALITTAVTAELGTHSSLRGNSKALSTVASIIDGTGSMGAALGPLIAGILTRDQEWSHIFYMMIVADIFSMLLLTRLVKREVGSLILRIRSR